MFIDDKLSKREHAVMNEAFMIGRVYNKMGEKEAPWEIQKKLIEKCNIVANSHTNEPTNCIHHVPLGWNCNACSDAHPGERKMANGKIERLP